jgi:hypothetical protein
VHTRPAPLVSIWRTTPRSRTSSARSAPNARQTIASAHNPRGGRGSPPLPHALDMLGLSGRMASRTSYDMMHI